MARKTKTQNVEFGFTNEIFCLVGQKITPPEFTFRDICKLCDEFDALREELGIEGNLDSEDRADGNILKAAIAKLKETKTENETAKLF